MGVRQKKTLLFAIENLHFFHFCNFCRGGFGGFDNMFQFHKRNSTFPYIWNSPIYLIHSRLSLCHNWKIECCANIVNFPHVIIVTLDMCQNYKPACCSGAHKIRLHLYNHLLPTLRYVLSLYEKNEADKRAVSYNAQLVKAFTTGVNSDLPTLPSF